PQDTRRYPEQSIVASRLIATVPPRTFHLRLISMSSAMPPRAGPLLDAEVVEVAAVASGVGGLVVGHVDADDGLAGGQAADGGGDVVPGIQGEVPALVGR